MTRRTRVSRWFRALLALGASALLLGAGGCGETRGAARILDETAQLYTSSLRWGDPLATLDLVDPELRAAFAPSDLERERWRQVQVAGIRGGAPLLEAPDRATQRIEMELINRNTQAVRSVEHVARWRYDPEAKRWWLETGLPKIDVLPR